MFLLQSLTPTSKLDNVLFSLPRKGADAMTKFIASLRASAEATDHNRIADLLEAAWTKKKSSKRVLRFTKGMFTLFCGCVHIVQTFSVFIVGHVFMKCGGDYPFVYIIITPKSAMIKIHVI